MTNLADNKTKTDTATVAVGDRVSATDQASAQWWDALPESLKAHYNRNDGSLTELGRAVNPAFATPSPPTAEEVEAVRTLLDRGYAKISIATTIGKSKAHVSRCIKVLNASRTSKNGGAS